MSISAGPYSRNGPLPYFPKTPQNQTKYYTTNYSIMLSIDYTAKSHGLDNNMVLFKHAALVFFFIQRHIEFGGFWVGPSS